MSNEIGMHNNIRRNEAEPEPQSEITRVMEMLRSSVEMMEQTKRELEDRLHAVLSPDVIGKTAECDKAEITVPPCSALFCEINGLYVRLEQLRTQYLELMDRLEIN